MNVSRQVIIQTSAEHGLGRLRALLAVAATSSASLNRLAVLAQMERHSLRKHLDGLVAAGVVKESRQSRSRQWWTMASQQTLGAKSDTVSDCVALPSERMDEAFALWALMKALAPDDGWFVIDFDVLAELADCSRGTLDRKFAEVQQRGRAERERVSRSEYKVTIKILGNVNLGTPPKTTQVFPRRVDTIQDRALAVLARLRSQAPS